MNPVAEAKNLLSGLNLLHDWLGEHGEPVNEMVAGFRAQRCLIGNNGQPCPENREPNWWDRHVKEPVAMVIRAELELKNNMKLHIAGEEGLNVCRVCGCCLRLKVHTPTQHIKDHVTKAQLLRTPPFCWMRSELLPD